MAKTVVVGQYGMTPQQMEAAGIIKPGSAALVIAMVNRGRTLAQSMPPNIFTGKQGAKSLASFTNNVPAQAKAFNTLFTHTQRNLQNAGVISGKENVSQIAGLIKAGAQFGIPATVAAVKNAGSGVMGADSGLVKAIGGVQSKVMGAIGSGNLAGKVADGVSSGLSSLTKSLSGAASVKGLAQVADAVKGVAASAFAQIKNAFPKLPAGVPVNVAAEAQKAAESAAAASSAIPGAAVNAASGALGKGTSLLNDAKNLGSSLQNSMSGGTAALGKTISGAVGGAAAQFQSAVQSATNPNAGASSALGAIGKIAGVATSLAPNAKGGAVLGALTGLANPNTSVQNVVAGAVTGAVSGAVNQTLDRATNGVSTTVLTVATAVNTVTGTTGSGITSAFGSVTNVANTLKSSISGTIIGTSSALASGLTNLPGGMGAAGAIVNNAKNQLTAVTGALGATLSNAASKLGQLKDAFGNLKSTIASKASAQLNNLKPPTLDAAAALAKSGLPAGAAAQLQSAISSMGAGGGSPVKMPVIALNTVNRGEITAQTSSLLGDPDIPPPNPLGEISEDTKNNLAQAEKDLAKMKDEAEKKTSYFFDVIEPKRKKLMADRDQARTSLPQGDPAIAAAEKAVDDFRAEWNKAKEDAISSRKASGLMA